MAPKPVNKKPAGAGRKKNGYVMPKKLPVGTVLQDTAKVQWISGPSIGVGGFGEIYSACRADQKVKNPKDYPYVIKIEPHGNGPLFVEMHFYMRNAKQEEIEKFKSERNLKALGMPYFVGSGSHDLQNDKHRFVVMPRYGSDIWSLFLANDKKIPLHTIYRLALQMIDVFEYIHHCTYVHADLKGANMLLGFGKGGDSQAYLVDFGLASHYTTNSEYKPDPKKMHNGTIEYTSRDAHNGVPTMRGDMEILGYNLIHWSGVTLPWEKEKLLTDPVKVQQSKEKHMKDIIGFMKACYGKEAPPAAIVNFVKYVANLKFNEVPDYTKCRKFFTTGLNTLGAKDAGPLQFSLTSKPRMSGIATTSKATVKPKSPARRTRTPTRSQDDSIIEIDDTPPPVVKKPRAKAKPKSPVDNKFKSPEEKKPKKQTDASPAVKSSPAPKASPVATNGKSKPATSASIKLGTPGKQTPGKQYHVNIDLDISVDADLIVNLKRKPKVPKSLNGTSAEDDEEVVPQVTKKSRPAPKKTKVTREDSFLAATEEDDDDDNDSDYQAPGPSKPPPNRKRKYQKKAPSSSESVAAKREKLNIPKTVARAGEYKGKKAKN